jgi:hypothetical protein
MNFHLHKSFEYLRDGILDTISNFNSFEPAFGTGKRNSIKKIEISGKNLVVKSFKKPILFNQLVYKFFRKSKARRSFEYATTLIELGIKTPKPIAYIEYFSMFGIQKSFYISEFVDYDLTFRELVHQPDYPENKAIVKEFTKFTYELHEKGVLFLDHSPGNTLILKRNGIYDFYLVDLNRMQFGPISFEKRMKNFSRLTPKKEMVELMSETYAKLSGKKVEKIFESMWFYNRRFQEKFHRKKELKKRFLGKK